MMIAFVIRRCAVELGHMPSAAELTAWANGGAVNTFGRPISEAEARVLLRHQARLVTARSANTAEQYVDDDVAAESALNVVRLADVRARRSAR